MRGCAPSWIISAFAYEFYSLDRDLQVRRASTQALLRILANYDKVMAVMLPTLGEERQQTYSPFLPVSPALGQGAARQGGGA